MKEVQFRDLDYYGLYYIHYKNSEVCLNFLPQQYASKWALFLEYDNPHSFYVAYTTLFFSLMNDLV